MEFANLFAVAGTVAAFLDGSDVARFVLGALGLAAHLVTGPFDFESSLVAGALDLATRFLAHAFGFARVLSAAVGLTNILAGGFRPATKLLMDSRCFTGLFAHTVRLAGLFADTVRLAGLGTGDGLGLQVKFSLPALPTAVSTGLLAIRPPARASLLLMFDIVATGAVHPARPLALVVARVRLPAFCLAVGIGGARAALVLVVRVDRPVEPIADRGF